LAKVNHPPAGQWAEQSEIGASGIGFGCCIVFAAAMHRAWHTNIAYCCSVLIHNYHGSYYNFTLSPNTFGPCAPISSPVNRARST